MKLKLALSLITAFAALPFVATYLVAQQAAAPVGSPLPGITSRELELFRMGREDFLEVETAAEGLGPVFNGTSCGQCHNIPAIGGTGTMVEMRAGHRDENGHFTAPPGGTLMHLFSIPPHNCQVSISAVYEEANLIGHRISMPLFGAGLVEAIPDETLLALEDPGDRNGDGISGRAAMVKDLATGRERVGRFGWKAQHATLLAFSADAYFNEMGITNDLFRHEVTAEADSRRLHPCDGKPDPEDVRDPRTGLRGIDNFEGFLKLLAPLPRATVTEEALRGEAHFNSAGCVSCHVPQLQTGPSANAVFNRKPVALFSDLLLHDIGTGDGIEQDAAKGEEFRTPALWGLRFRRPLLHDGSASTIQQAIQRHTGEAARVTERYLALPEPAKAELIAFLKTL
ncbi:MAG TPA: di-heme oxidoredictase family protein [Candidatus Saccharimonadales bacterium]|nr:di-heme oxidoredictase family protein [Candidatus Saccharimonadales bacterium]